MNQLDCWHRPGATDTPRIGSQRLRHAASLATAIMAIGFCASLVEFALRTWRFAPMPLGIPGLGGVAGFPDRPEGRFRFRYNELGDRTKEPAAASSPGFTRVLIVGDSHAWGSGVDDEDRFSDRLEGLSAQDRRWLVFNVASPGSSFATYWEKLKHGFDVYNPELVVVCAYSGNDLIEMATDARRVKRASRNPGPRYPSLSRLRLYHLLRFVVGAPALTVSNVLCASGAYTQALAQAGWAARSPGQLDEALGEASSWLKAIRRETDNHGTPLLVVVLPSKLQVEPQDDWVGGAATAAALGLRLGDAATVDQRIHRRIVDLGRTVGPCIDGQQVLSEASQGGRVYFPRDWHLNERGHQALARRLRTDLTALLRAARPAAP